MDRTKRHRHLLGPGHTSRLRKVLLFELARQLNMLSCYRCLKPIETVDLFSIDHRIDWEHSKSPKEIFFDVENIAFSHLSCNVGAARRPNKKYETFKEYKRAEFSRYYAKHKDRLNHRRRKKRRTGARKPYKP